MFRIDLLQNEWLMLALIGGTALVAATILWYVAFWRTGSTSRFKVPAFLIVVYVAIALVAIGYVAARIWYPPNW